MRAASSHRTIFVSWKRFCTPSISVAQVPVQLPHAGATTLFDALLNHLQITRLTRKMIEAYATIGQCHSLSGLLIPEQQAHLEKYTYDRGLIDLLHDYPGVLLDPADFVAMLPKLSPRLYSISSSPSAHAGEIHTTVAVVRYRSHNRERGGVCSTLLADRVPPGESPADLHPAQQEVPLASAARYTHHHDRPGHRHRSISQLSS